MCLLFFFYFTLLRNGAAFLTSNEMIGSKDKCVFFKPCRTSLLLSKGPNVQGIKQIPEQEKLPTVCSHATMNIPNRIQHEEGNENLSSYRHL